MNFVAATRSFHRLPVALACLLSLGAVPAQASDAHAPAKAAPKAEAKVDSHAKPAAEAPKAAAKAAPADNLDVLRERLAEKLGAAKPPEAKSANLVRVTARLDAPKADGHDGHAAPSAAPRKPSAAVMAAVDAHRAEKASTAAVAAAGHGAPGAPVGPVRGMAGGARRAMPRTGPTGAKPVLPSGAG